MSDNENRLVLGRDVPVLPDRRQNAAGRNPTPLVEVLGDRIAVQDASGAYPSERLQQAILDREIRTLRSMTT